VRLVVLLPAADVMCLCCAVPVLCLCCVCCAVVRQDTNLWHKLAMMSEEQGYIRQAIYCWNKVSNPPYQHSHQMRTIVFMRWSLPALGSTCISSAGPHTSSTVRVLISAKDIKNSSQNLASAVVAVHTSWPDTSWPAISWDGFLCESHSFIQM
jgi:hypothetical protein